MLSVFINAVPHPQNHAAEVGALTLKLNSTVPWNWWYIILHSRCTFKARNKSDHITKYFRITHFSNIKQVDSALPCRFGCSPGSGPRCNSTRMEKHTGTQNTDDDKGETGIFSVYISSSFFTSPWVSPLYNYLWSDGSPARKGVTSVCSSSEI